MLRPVALLLLPLLPLYALAQNVGINANGAAPAASAMLDIDVTALPANAKQGLLVPRIALTATNVAAPVVGPAASLLVYNTNTAGAGLTAVSPGYYYWGGAQWVRFAQDGVAWQLLGNAGTVAATNFLGTTDNVALRLRTNNLERFEISTGTGGAAGTGGRLWAFQDGTAALPIYSWSANNNTGIFRPLASTLGFSTNAVERFRIPNANQVHAMADGTAALPFYSWGANTNLGMYRIGANILGLSTTGLERMRIQANGQVSVNNAAPPAGYQFHVAASAGLPTAIYGVAAGDWDGVHGQAGGPNGFGLWGRNLNVNGTAVVGAGNNLVSFYMPAGSGGAFTGFTTSTYHFYTTGGVGQAALMQDAFGAQWNVGLWNPGYWKILGTGLVGTVVKDLEDRSVALICPEAPDALFQDHGMGQLVNGRARISFDPIYSKNILVDSEHPIKVFVQLEGECNGVYVTNKSAQGFEVVELMNGASNAPFAWSVVAQRANETLSGPNGTREVDYRGRWQPAPKYETPVNVEATRGALGGQRE
ncbi:MAG: hypothetical protein KIT10_05600 [Flavobacteriales bacterium]|nr:hypothetical protein [Flavobacteriales bacterium]